MKRTLVTSILGIALSFATAVSSRGQGWVAFNNYLTFGSVGAPIFLEDGITPLPVSKFRIDLRYQLGNVAWPMDTGTLIATTLIGEGGVGAGYYDGGIVQIPDYPSSGAPPAGGITFQVVAVATGPYGLPSGYYKLRGGFSEPLNLPSIATGANPPTELDIPSFQFVTPEPSSVALAGLGAAVVWILRRRR
jgi:hypothetical protein